MKTYLSLGILFVLMPAILFAAGNEFSRNLKFGMKGEDVRDLQILLNTDSETRVAESGAGSPGNETDYFGPATKRALIKFQEKYRDEVLTPVGVVSGTGFFGEKTRTKILAIRQGKASPVAPLLSGVSSNTKNSSVVLPVEKGDVFIIDLSHYSGREGTTITMNGKGFTKTGNTIYFGDTYTVDNVSSADGQNIIFKAPAIPKGLYYLHVKNARGESDREAFFVITDGVTPEPSIKNVEYTSNTIVIHGSGFSASGNMVRTGIGVYKNIRSFDGKTIVVPITLSFGDVGSLPKPTIFIDAPVKKIESISIPVSVFVINKNGVSNNASFTLGL